MTSDPRVAGPILNVGDRVQVTHFDPPSDIGTLRRIEDVGPVHRDRTHYVEFDTPPGHLPDLRGVWLKPETLRPVPEQSQQSTQGVPTQASTRHVRSDSR